MLFIKNIKYLKSKISILLITGYINFIHFLVTKSIIEYSFYTEMHKKKYKTHVVVNVTNKYDKVCVNIN